MSTTTVNSCASTFVGRELSERVMKASSQAGTDDGKLKTILDGFDTIIRDSQTSKEEKELAEFAKGFTGKISCAPKQEKGLTGLFRGLMQEKTKSTSFQIAAADTFLSAMASTSPVTPGVLMAESVKKAALSAEDNTKALNIMNNGLDEILGSTKATQDEKTLANFGKMLINSSPEHPYMARVAGATFLTAIATLNNGPVVTSIISAIKNGTDEIGDTNTAVQFLDKASDRLLSEALLSQDQKSLLSFGREFSNKVSGSPAVKVAAAKTFLDALGSASMPRPSSIMAKAVSEAASQAENYNAGAKIIEDGFSEIIISADTSQQEKALAATGKKLMNEISSCNNIKAVTGKVVLDEIASAHTGSAVPVMAKAVKAAVSEARTDDEPEVMSSGCGQILSHSDGTGKEKLLAASGQYFGEMMNTYGRTGIRTILDKVLDAISSGNGESNVETVVRATRTSLDAMNKDNTEKTFNGVLESALKVLDSKAQASSHIRDLAKIGLSQKSYSDRLKTLQQIEEAVKAEPGMTTAIEEMKEACNGGQHSRQIETEEDKVNIDGVKISKRALALAGSVK